MASGRRSQIGDRPSPAQLATLHALVVLERANCQAPSIREIGASLGIVSSNAVAQHLRQLVVKGYLLTAAKGSSRRWRLSPRGAGLIGLQPREAEQGRCPHCGGSLA